MLLRRGWRLPFTVLDACVVEYGLMHYILEITSDKPCLDADRKLCRVHTRGAEADYIFGLRLQAWNEFVRT